MCQYLISLQVTVIIIHIVKFIHSKMHVHLLSAYSLTERLILVSDKQEKSMIIQKTRLVDLSSLFTCPTPPPPPTHIYRPWHKLLSIFWEKWLGSSNQEIWATLLGNFGNNWRNFEQGLVLTFLSVHTKYQLADTLTSHVCVNNSSF